MSSGEPPAIEIDEQAVRALLPHAWHAFYGRFGRLKQVQKLAVGPILGGQSTLVCAPTATGKTEAVMAPAIERLLRRRQKAPVTAQLEMMIVAPTRALCNDLMRRLRRPVVATKLSIAIKTGDHASFNDKTPPDILITTPESLDSMLVRRPTALRQLQCILIDELHLLDHTPRGDQLACLLSRLDKVSESPVQRCAASATVPDEALLASRFLGEQAAIVKDRTVGLRQIQAWYEYLDDDERVADWLRDRFVQRDAKKILVFANARARVENISSKLGEAPSLEHRIFAHHGSLARPIRLKVERAFLDAPSAICVATMTLELGVDIGDVDLVVLLGPPPNVSSFLQRIGRGDRTENFTRVVCVYRDEFERHRLEHLAACASQDLLFPEGVAFRPTVIAQQALSLVFQNPRGWVSPGAVHSRLPAYAASRWSESDCRRVLAGLAAGGYVRQIDGGRYVADEKAGQLKERGQIHSVIVDSPEQEVVDELTGQVIGRIRVRREEPDGAKPSENHLVLAGQRRRVTRVREGQVFVEGNQAQQKTEFSVSGPIRYSFELAQDFARFQGLPQGELRAFRMKSEWGLSHYFGSVWGVVLEHMLSLKGLKAEKFQAFFGSLDVAPDAGLRWGSSQEIFDNARGVLTKKGRRSRIVRLLQPGPFLGMVPEDLVTSWLEESIDFQRFADTLRECVITVEGAPREVEE